MRRSRLRPLWWRSAPIFWFLLLFFALPARAAPPCLDVTWPDVVRRVAAHPRLAAGRSEVDAARSGVGVAGAVPNPTLEVSAGRGAAQAGVDVSAEWGLALDVPLGWIAQRGARKGAARAELDVALAEQAVLTRDVLLRLRTLFWNLAYEQDKVRTFDELETQTAALAQSVRSRVDKGESRPVEAIRVEIELEKVAGERQAAQASLAARQAELGVWIGVPADQGLRAVADLADVPPVLDRDAALTQARKAHPSLALAAARTRLTQAEADTERGARVPQVSATGFAASELDRRAFGVALTMDLPLWNWNTDRIARADARVAAARQQADAATAELDVAVIEAQSSCQTAVETARRFREQIVPRSELAAATMEKTFRLGEVSLLEVIDARRTLLDARRLSTSALAQARIECGRLQSLIGEATP